MGRKRRWNELSPGMRRFVVISGAIEGVLKIAALVDLSRRMPEEVNGSKRAWALAIVFVNSLGLVPIAYFVARRRDRPVVRPAP